MSLSWKVNEMRFMDNCFPKKMNENWKSNNMSHELIVDDLVRRISVKRMKGECI